MLAGKCRISLLGNTDEISDSNPLIAVLLN